MAKKKKEVEVVEEPQVESVIDETPVVEPELEPIAVVEKPKDKGWEFKDRLYYLKSKRKPISYSIRASGIYWFDKELGYERELKYCKNQKTPFVDEMKGDQRLEHIIFRDGSLFVPKEEVTLQKLLSLYHPHNGQLFYEHKPVEIAENELDILEAEVEALMTAKTIDIDLAEAIMRVEIGSKVSEMSSKELRRDLLLYAKRNPFLFLELATDDNVVLRNFGIKATEAGIIKLSNDQRHFMWGTNNRKIMTVPFDEHPYSALAQWFKTDEGMEVYTNIEKRLN
tara:strand:- start:17980 stop:18825 length:846 start_codon:yes stop_codon:yes gene_type:complete